jgi:ABC-type amino acid transport substrate-binding protein
MRGPMKYSKIHLGLLLVLIILTSGTIAEAEENYTLKIATMKLPPYGWIDQDKNKHGLVFEISEEIGIRSGLPFTNEILPFNRMLSMLKDGKIDILSSQPHQKALDAGDKLGIIFKINVIAATKKNSGISKIEDFKGKQLIYHLGSSYHQLEGLPKKIIRVSSYKQALEMLYKRKRVDGAVFSEPAYYHYMRQIGLNSDDFGKIIYIERDKEQWIFVRKGIPREIKTKIKKVVYEIFQEDMWDKLLVKYGFTSWQTSSKGQIPE